LLRRAPEQQKVPLYVTGLQLESVLGD
jgi:hypothetical protein